MSFRGFSEDDIRKYKTQDNNKAQKGSSYKTSLKQVTYKQSRVNQSSKPKMLLNNNAADNVSIQEVPDNAKLSVKPDSKTNIAKNSQSNQHKAEEKQDDIVIQTKPEEECEPPVKENRKFKNLDEFEARQKLIEEQNRKRKELLAKALADRTKRTQEEAQKLGEIQEEFKKLDAMLSSDVKILRKEIELASIDFMECQKRYRKIEREYLDAKVLLHQKQEKKEMLTEHLCTIIEKNEERKAEKLNELLERLQLAPTENSVGETGNNVIQESVGNNK